MIFVLLVGAWVWYEITSQRAEIAAHHGMAPPPTWGPEDLARFLPVAVFVVGSSLAHRWVRDSARSRMKGQLAPRAGVEARDRILVCRGGVGPDPVSHGGHLWGRSSSTPTRRVVRRRRADARYDDAPLPEAKPSRRTPVR